MNNLMGKWKAVRYANASMLFIFIRFFFHFILYLSLILRFHKDLRLLTLQT